MRDGRARESRAHVQRDLGKIGSLWLSLKGQAFRLVKFRLRM